MSIETQMMILVERVVRPIRASGARKDKMRQELLAHLFQHHEEAIARGDDEYRAYESIKKRFGDPVELRKELQGTVPFWERLLYVKIPLISHLEPYCQGWRAQRTGESVLDHSFRITGIVVAMCSCLIVLVFAYFYQTSSLAGSLGVKIRIAVGLMSALAFQTFFILLIGHRISRLTEKRPIPFRNMIQAWLLCLLYTIPLCLGGVIFGAVVQNDLRFSFRAGWPAENIMLSLGGFITYVVLSLQRERQRRQWEALDLAD